MLSLFRTGSFTAARGLTSPGGEFLDVGMIVVGSKVGFLAGFRRQLESILTFSSGSPIHLVIITDQNSISQVAHFIGRVLSRYEASNIFKTNPTFGRH